MTPDLLDRAERPALVVPFTKMNGAGNDFVVLDNRFLRFSDDELAELARRVCPRRTGVGADGLLALDEPDGPPTGGDLRPADGDRQPAGGDREPAGDAPAHFRMRYRNADGSPATMCGNGARCLARFAARAGLGEESGGAVALAFDTDGGPYRAEVAGRAASGPVRLAVPPARDAGASVEGAVSIWTGTEHAVVFAADVDAADVAGEGRRLRRHPAFAPAGTNVDFVEVAGPGRIRVRTYEKGVEAETLACGTGAVAAALAAFLEGHLGPAEAVRQSVAVEMPGGTLEVGFEVHDGEPAQVTLSGPAETVYHGTFEWRGA